MAGINNSGRANPDDYQLGRGIIYFAPQDATSGPVNGEAENGLYRDLGNATEFNLTVDSETLEHTSSLQGLQTVDKEVRLSQQISFAFTLDEINFDNLAEFFSGTPTEVEAAPLNPTAFFSVNGAGPTSALPAGSNDQGACLIRPTKAGRWVDLVYNYANGSTFTGGLSGAAVNANQRWYDLDPRKVYGAGNNESQVVVVYGITQASVETGGTPAGTATEGTDYEIDYTFGRIFIIDGGAMDVPAVDVWIRVDIRPHEGDGTAGAPYPALHQTVKAVTKASISGTLKFVADNPADDGHKTEYQLHNVSLQPEGDFSLIGDEFTTMQFTGTIESSSIATQTDPRTLTITTHDGGSQPSFSA